MFTFIFGEAAVKILGVDYVPPDKVIQFPKLLPF